MAEDTVTNIKYAFEMSEPPASPVMPKSTTRSCRVFKLRIIGEGPKFRINYLIFINVSSI